MSRGYVLFDTPCGGSLQDLPCPVSSKLHLLSGLLETLGEGASFLCQPVSGEKKKNTHPWKQFTEPCRNYVQQPCCLAMCPRWERCLLSWSSNPPLHRHYPLVGSSGETNRHCSSGGPCPSCFLLGNQETFCLKKRICQISTARQLVKAFALLFERVS